MRPIHVINGDSLTSSQSVVDVTISIKYIHRTTWTSVWLTEYCSLVVCVLSRVNLIRLL